MSEMGATTGGPTLRWAEPAALDAETERGFLGPGAPFELVVEDVAGHPCETFRTRASGVDELIRRASNHGDRPFLIDGGRTVTFTELAAVVGRAAENLRSAGVQGGDRVVVLADTSLDAVLAVLGVVAAGAVVVPANPRWGPAERTHALDVTAPALVLTDGSHALDDTSIEAPVEALGSLVPRAPDHAGAPDQLATAEEDQPFAIVFTSGTTGRSKGATLSHRNAVHFCMSTALTSLVRGLVSGVSPGRSATPTLIASAPLFHISGLLGQLVNGLCWGLTLVMPPPGRWDPAEHLALTERHGVTTWSLVPTQLHRIIEHPGLDRYDLHTLSTVGGGGATFSPDLLQRVTARLPHVRAGMRVGYGMTEATGSLTLLQPPIEDHELSSVGRPVAGAEIQIRRPDGSVADAGEVGMIWARSASIFLGYWGDDDATVGVFDAHRWYATGDFGRTDGELLWLESRLRDLIIRGGENIYPIEIENRLVEHPAIATAAVVGEDDEDLGQVVKAAVVPVAGAELVADDVRRWVGEALAAFKVPSIVEFREELPTNELGKVLKHLL